MRRRGFLIGAAAWPVVGLAAPAPAWAVRPERSEVRFAYSLDGRAAEGRFAAFAGAGAFDRSAPEAARFELRIESASIDLGSRLVSLYATSSEWFDARNHPAVVYRLTGLTPLGGTRYAAAGEIRVKGRAAETVSEIALEIGEGRARAAGALALSRSAFGLGTELSDLFVEIGDAVTVRFDLVATRAG